MCFKIDAKAKRWKNTTVYKIVELADLKDSGTIKIAPFKHNQIYREGYSVEAHGESKKKNWDGHWVTESGIYVLKTVRAARKYAEVIGKTNPDRFVIVDMDVDPKDFLHQAARARGEENGPSSATYRKVTVGWRVLSVLTPTKLEARKAEEKRVAEAIAQARGK